ncbi:VCBS repeat-containing protein [Terrimonas alba]|uniref:VCBS repeat-containing protein n=1 Tax=Terrimonas alba TaxID=3349636 RepID=UPI0035F36D86
MALIATGLLVFFSCNREEKFFTVLSPDVTGIYFQNTISEADSFNILDYLYFYNGGGVAIGDVNNDGLQDIYFTSNRESNRLYLNKGNFGFEDITDAAGIAGKGNWKTGVTMADVNNDGLLDIYVCEVGKYKSLQGRNELFINNGSSDGKNSKVSFTERAAEYGLDIEGFNTQASFFDYDKDGDLDMFLVNHSVHSTDTYVDTAARRRRNEVSGDKLFRCDKEGDKIVYHEVTEQAGIYSSIIGYGLNVVIADFNNDNWDDIYVSNDFHENDYYYLNNQNGTFSEINRKAFGHESRFSMGSDAGDVNNDGWLDIITLDMLPADEKVLKSSVSDDNPDVYDFKMSKGYHHQNARNCLQLNVAGGKKFSDIGLYAGIAATDWSWSPLLADFDNDGIKDLFVTNGILRRPNDLDFLKFISAADIAAQIQKDKSADRLAISKMPEGKVSNYIFRGTAELKFTDQTRNWGIDMPNLSNGAAYGDLDNDGNLDLVVNNINSPAGIYRNNSNQQSENHYLDIQLRSAGNNKLAYGSKVVIKTKEGIQLNYLTATRGFESSSSPVLHFGLGKTDKVDSLQITWPDGSLQTMTNIKGGQLLIIEQKSSEVANRILQPAVTANSFFKNVTDSFQVDYRHQENLFFDFNSQQLIPHGVSAMGPKLAVADVNGDGLDDFFVGGAKGQVCKLFQQTVQGKFISTNEDLFRPDSLCEDINAVFFDADGDRDEDLYVVSGGNEMSGNNPALLDRLYINNGKGRFTKDSLPLVYGNKSVAIPADIDHDGDLDLFVGGRVVTNRYGETPQSYILVNNGKASFTVADERLAPGLQKIGMVTDAAWADLDKDGWKDLVIVGEWMPIVVYKNTSGKLQNATSQLGLQEATGLWTSVYASDIDKDGYEDLLVGNWGENSKLQVKNGFPLQLYTGDLDKNGDLDQLMSIEKDGRYYFFLGKEEIERVLPGMIKKKFLDYKTMAGLTVDGILGDKLNEMSKLTVSNLSSVLVKNNKGNLQVTKLPFPVQWSPVFAFVTGDFNRDGADDIITAGNFFGVLPFEGRYDASYGNLLLNQSSSFISLPSLQSGLQLDGQVRDIKKIKIRGKDFLIIARNNDSLLFYGN